MFNRKNRIRGKGIFLCGYLLMKSIAKIFIAFLIFFWIFIGWPGIQPAQAAQVTFQAAGAGFAIATTANLTPAYPSPLVANDVILLQVTVRNIVTTPTTP
ncbi:MAG: hypothetical protein WAW67_04525, partial [Candidatus Omnitrophota bacterium]